MSMTSGAGPAPVFEFGLSLAGGVSCGSFTAGAIDFIVEALDAWEAARQAGDDFAPPHRVVLRIVAGASSGALTAAVLGAALPYAFPPIRASSTDNQKASNPLFDSWVNMTGLANLLGSQDRRAGRLRSVLDPTHLDLVARKAIDFGLRATPHPRGWLADPLRVAFTVTNLRGVTYPVAHPSSTVPNLTSTVHGDVLRFAIAGLGGERVRDACADEHLLAVVPNAPDAWDTWGKRFATAALASAGFPVFLPPRRLKPHARQYIDAPFVLHGGDCAPDRLQLASPVGAAALSGYEFDAVDGGLIDNDAVDLVRMELANSRDPRACNPRDGLLSRRAVLMVDPMLGAPSEPIEASHPATLGSAVTGLLRTFLDQARLKPEDIALATQENLYSRFIIVPRRGEAVRKRPSDDLAGASLGGLGGYLACDFRRHDFLLGRRNAQQALAEHFVLRSKNPLFDGWTAAQRERYRVPGRDELPVIPLVGALHPRKGTEEPLPEWPLHKAHPAAFSPALGSRLNALYCHLLQPWWIRLALYPLWLLVRGAIRRRLVAAMIVGLRKHGLS